ncbi:A-kinase anchor protein 17A-like [Dipodomys spectabilis]|uniref:A-kinase anchor protein 17A-like n=1 Tax=Dipodomys spectabilis TaxID=105255 RepID=UPI001C547AC2|nr:A-kinase anchor protein 17A-like [Dipodomys spectabilis]
MAAATIVHDASEAVELCGARGLFLKPITKMTISVALPALRQPGKSISNWEVMERLKAMVATHQFSTLRIAKSTMDFIRFEGEVENRALVRAFLARLDGKTIKLSGFAEALRVRAAEFKSDFPTRHDWDSFFRDARDMNETLPGERPDTVHLEGLPCKWFAPGGSERPSEDVLVSVFEKFGAIRHVDIPMLDPYREEMTGRSFHTFSFGGHLNFEAYVQYREYAGFLRAMAALRGMKLMFKGEDGKAVACNIKVTFDSTKHLSDASIRKRQLERQKLQELEQQREEQKRREKEAEERQRAEERKQQEQEAQARARRREERRRRREQRQRARQQRRQRRREARLQAEEQRRLQEKIRAEERRLLLAQRNLQSVRLVAALLARAKAARLAAREREEERRRSRAQAERRRVQEAELRRVEEEKRRALGLQRKERALRERLLGLLLAQGPAPASTTTTPASTIPASTIPASTTTPASEDALLRLLRSVQALAAPSDAGRAVASRPHADPREADARAGAPAATTTATTMTATTPPAAVPASTPDPGPRPGPLATSSATRPRDPEAGRSPPSSPSSSSSSSSSGEAGGGRRGRRRRPGPDGQRGGGQRRPGGGRAARSRSRSPARRRRSAWTR